MSKIYKFVFICCLNVISSVSYGQSPTAKVTFTPYGNPPFWYGESTSFSLGYYVDDESVITPICGSKTASVTGNGGASATINPTQDAVLVTWGAQKTTTAKVNITLGSCNNSLFNNPFPSQNSYAVMSIVGETPSDINGTTSVPICQASALTYSISPMQIPNGVGRAASGYEWTIPAGWKFSDGTVSNGSGRLFTSESAYTQSFTPDCNNANGSITVRAWTNTEGKGIPHYSLPKALPISRSPSLTITTPSEIKCGVPFTASVPDLPCVGPSAYAWNLPTGWTMSGTGRTRSITPAGSTSQTLTVNITLPNGCVVSTSKSISPINSGSVSGPPSDAVCSGGNTFALDNAPTNSTITWSVTPANRVVTASGTGASAYLVPGSNPGQAILKFTVSGACSYEVSRAIYVGSIQLQNITISAFDESVGGYPYVCPNGVYVTTIGPVNENYSYEVQVTNGYATQFGQNPGTFVINIGNYTPSPYVDASISARVNNGCGWSAWKTINLYSDPFSCPPGGGCELCLMLYPNPSSEEVSISLEGVKEYEEKTGKELSEGMVYIYDLNGNLKKSEKISKQKTIYIRDLPSGQYVVHYQNGKYVTKRHLKVEK